MQALASGWWHRDPWFYALLALGPLAWLLPEPVFRIAIWRLTIMALAEELLFRGLIQQFMLRRPLFQHRLGPLTLANVAASILFVLAHLVAQPPLWAAAVFIPSLIFGWIWDRHGRVVPCTMVHFWYNLCFFLPLSAIGSALSTCDAVNS
ncbi:JDVT-CTERM system glutamic-type intramembrane protease MrtJ [Desulfonatronum thiosulfatophilum]|uniref:JDVT-CTERM system glutamic-type intramembrane protease MrtJ n=1 Tax=Desulfonatronum thiosulfatophilum TaxID=617002 RepID=UPI000B898A5E|nr:JDVT-CTERM system glutamic-type intramembrane protease [Desulfonatronum thiosulfatophilum]